MSRNYLDYKDFNHRLTKSADDREIETDEGFSLDDLMQELGRLELQPTFRTALCIFMNIQR